MMQIDWADTPGGYYAIAYLISCGMIALNSPRRAKDWRHIGLAALQSVLVLMLMITTNDKPVWLFVPYMILIVLLLWGIVYHLCSYDGLTAFYFTVRAFIIGEFIASLEFQIFYYAVLWGLLPLSQAANLILLAVVDGALICLLYHLEKRNRKGNAQIVITRHELVSAITIAVAIYAVSNLSYIFKEMHLSNIVISQLYTIRTLMDFGGMAILYAYHVQLGEMNMRYEVNRLSDMLEMQYNNYEMLQQSVEVVNQKYHDLKYQIHVLKAETDMEESRKYLEQMEREIKAYEAQNKTGNKVLDTILTGKSLYCQNHWIELTSVADGHALDFMDAMDLSVLFGNMLDNAIESVMKIEKKERRLIHLAVTEQKNFVRIRMENCYEQEPEFEHGVLKTSKEDKRYHGFGMKSIRSIVKKYGGSTTVAAKDGWFELRILIPINPK